jgi:cytochrome c5
MKHCVSLRAMSRLGRALVGLAVTLILVSCGLGEAVMPDPPPGEPADRSVGVVIAVPAPIPHSLAGREECYSCHAIGAVDAPPVPVDHEKDVEFCTTCHAEWLAPAIAAAAPPAIPHELEGRGDCLVCHKLGTADAPRVPDNHDGLTSDICQTCHTAVDEISEGEEEGPVAEIPSIPHGLEGFSACTSCHAQGGSGIPRMPDDHEGRTDDLCSACHEPAVEEAEVTPSPTAPASAEPTETPATLAGDAAKGQVLYAARCAVCHGAEGEGTTIAPDALNDSSLIEELIDEDLTTTIRMGVSGKMPASPNLSDQDVLDIIALLRSWQ